ncbi:MAG: class I SAM-dependent methyltransferase [Spirochaetales bacterium]|nr:class I SAM-dependent methyltransferase [Leptospiraceae bacterium]MCP5483508.1 class I SAM-dependent methyltransferase [Spirochaetales bacterium]MCP5486740.1 class I SAM-dependent methyltransferase [Spirochaetales bacterium]
MIAQARKILEQVPFKESYRLLFPDGSEVRSGSDPVFEVHFKTEDALSEMLVNPAIGFGEAYMRGEIEITGDFQAAVHFGFVARSAHLKPTLRAQLEFLWGYLRRRNTLQGSRKNIAAHYDLGNEFYSLWLDRDHKQYTCAYFERPDNTIEQAQRNKLDLVCRKLRLEPGQEVVEAGCGWGGFALYAAQHYGVRMRSYNISKEQIEFARERARKAGLGPDRVEYIHDDYRTIGQDGRVYDRFVSIGMLEHVGLENYGTLYDIIHRVTKVNGRALVHSIGREAPTPMDPWLEKYIFPGAYIPSLAEMVTPVEKKERPLHVVDVENLRFHYALTLDQWCLRLQKNRETIIKMYDESFYRMFRLYLEASAAGFRYGGIQLYQILLSNGYDDSAPLTRHHMLGLSAPGKKNGASRNGVHARASAPRTRVARKSTSRAGRRK